MLLCVELVWVLGVKWGRMRGTPGSGASTGRVQHAGLRGPRPCGGWCGAEVRCQSWEWHARSEVLSSRRFLNLEAYAAIFQRRADSFKYCSCVGGRAGDEITELCECCFWLLLQCFSVPSLLHSQASAEGRPFTAISPGELLCSGASGVGANCL